MYNPDTHHRRSIRLRGFDYSSDGAYFITICTWQRECLFGEVFGGEVIRNDAGEKVSVAWEGLSKRFPAAEVSDYVVMPNHFHGILHIPGRGAACRAHDRSDIETGGAASSAPTLGDMVRAFKSLSAVSVNRLLDREGIPLWQRNYYEHIIRSEDDLANIRRYIAENPLKWDMDENNPANAG